jgi:hypothetical protein
MERIAMSQEERDWLDWLKRARDGKMTQREAGERMEVERALGADVAEADATARRRRSGAWITGTAIQSKARR